METEEDKFPDRAQYLRVEPLTDRRSDAQKEAFIGKAGKLEEEFLASEGAQDAFPEDMEDLLFKPGWGGLFLDKCVLHANLHDTGTMLHTVNIAEQYQYLTEVNGFEAKEAALFEPFGGEEKLETSDLLFFLQEDGKAVNAAIITECGEDGVKYTLAGGKEAILTGTLGPDSFRAETLARARVVHLTFASNEFVTYAFCINEMNMSPAAACGVIANISHESGFDTKAGNAAYGLCQWTKERRTALQDFCREKDLDAGGLVGQLRFLKEELENDAKYAELREILCSLGNEEADAATAARQWCWKFEQPADTDTIGRQRADLAEEYFALYVAEETDITE